MEIFPKKKRRKSAHYAVIYDVAFDIVLLQDGVVFCCNSIRTMFSYRLRSTLYGFKNTENTNRGNFSSRAFVTLNLKHVFE